MSSNHRKSKSARFLEAMGGAVRVDVILHDYPDPDAISSGWAVTHLIKKQLGLETSIFSRGTIARAENLHLLKLLSPPVKLVDLYQERPGTALVFVDCNPLGKNHLLAGRVLPVAAVLDHHEYSGRRAQAAFCDIQKSFAACATLAAHYLMEQGLVPPQDIATALLYGLRTETKGADGIFTRKDLRALGWLTDYANHNQVNEIENAPLRSEYYTDLVCALQNTFVYGDSALCFLPFASGQEIVGEVADLLIRGEEITRSLCAAVVANKIVLSVRTERAGGDAVELLRRTIDGLGDGGGHVRRAGGKIPLEKEREAISEEQESLLRVRWLKACGLDERRGVRLVRRRTILESLA